jgi:hypothetical protein
MNPKKQVSIALRGIRLTRDTRVIDFDFNESIKGIESRDFLNGIIHNKILIQNITGLFLCFGQIKVRLQHNTSKDTFSTFFLRIVFLITDICSTTSVIKGDWYVCVYL